MMHNNQAVDYKEEMSTKLLFIIQHKFQIDAQELRPVVDTVLSSYSVDKECTALVTTDIHEKLRSYIETKTLEHVQLNTLKNYYREISNFGKHIIKPVNAVTIMDLRRYLAPYHGKVKQSTMNNKISMLKTFFTWLHTEGYIDANPSLKLKQVKTEKRVRQPLTEEELELLIDSCKTPREEAILNMLYATGCRVSELVGMNKNDIDWHEKSLLVIGKGDKQREVLFTTRAKVSLQKYLETRVDNNDALFVTSKKPYNRLGRRSVLREVQQLGERVGDGIHVFPHRLRHSFADKAINSNMPLLVVQELMGHTFPQTTTGYGRASRELIKQEYAKL